MSEQAQTPVDINSISMMDLTGLSMSDVKEVRSEKLPVGVYQFQVKQYENKKDTGKHSVTGEDVPKFVQIVQVAVTGIQSLAGLSGTTVDPATLVGKVFNHRISKNIENGEPDIHKWLGLVKAFAVDIGVDGTVAFGDMCNQMVGKQFTAPIKHKQDQNDKDVSYANLVTDKIKKAA